MHAFPRTQGYDTEVVESQPDAILAFTGKDVFPDMVVVDADHSYNTLQVRCRLHSTAVPGLGGDREDGFGVEGCVSAVLPGHEQERWPAAHRMIMCQPPSTHAARTHCGIPST